MLDPSFEDLGEGKVKNIVEPISMSRAASGQASAMSVFGTLRSKRPLRPFQGRKRTFRTRTSVIWSMADVIDGAAVGPVMTRIRH